MKKLSLLLFGFLMVFTLMACNPASDTTTTAPIETEYTVTFNTDGGSAVDAVTVASGATVTEPTDPTWAGHIFVHWYVSDSETAYDFSTAVTADLTLVASWSFDEASDLGLIYADIAEYEKEMMISDNEVATPWKIAVNNTKVKWKSESDYITDEGVILPLPEDVAETTGKFIGTFTKGEEEVVKEFDIPLVHNKPVEIANSRVVPFENHTDEYEVANSDVTLYFEENGTVPYIKVEDFFTLLTGFIDPEVEMTKTTVDGVLTIAYQYYSEDEDVTYDLSVVIDSVNNTISAEDPGFYWAYVSTTETNYGRHIEYVQDHPDEYYEEGETVVYNLSDYNMDIVMHEEKVVVPFYIANQLFAGLSYFNVYYNTDALYGIYSLPSSSDRVFGEMHSSSVNNDDIPGDLVVHTYDMLAFNMNYLYGLQDIMEVDDYYNVMAQNKEDLLSQDAEILDQAICDFLLKDIDEPHTSYGYHSYFNKTSYSGPAVNSLAAYGSRFQTWYYDAYVDVDDAIAAKWGEGLGNAWAATNKPDYWLLDSKTAMLTLNGFSTADIEESLTYDETLVEKVMDVEEASGLLAPITQGDQFWYYNSSNDNYNVVELLVKNVNENYLATYEAALVSLGLTKVEEVSDEDYKDGGYYTVTVGGEDYMVMVRYDSDTDLFYVGVAKSVPATYEGNWAVKAEVSDLVHSDSAVYMEMMLTMMLLEQPTTENVILDLTWNGGGNVGALYRVMGFITDEAFETSSIDGDTGNNGSTGYVEIGDGIPSYSYLNWSLLTSAHTFSAANSMSTYFMVNELGPIIGVKTGGGACSITPILLPNGTAFTMSSNNIGAYRTGTGTESDPYVYHDNEFGIAPDYPLDVTNLYKVDLLLDILYNQEGLGE